LGQRFHVASFCVAETLPFSRRFNPLVNLIIAQVH